jgi:hypothetical protein
MGIATVSLSTRHSHVDELVEFRILRHDPPTDVVAPLVPLALRPRAIAQGAHVTLATCVDAEPNQRFLLFAVHGFESQCR